MIEALAAHILDKAADAAVELLADSVQRKNEQLRRDQERGRKGSVRRDAPILSATLASARPVLRTALVEHVEEVRRWCDQIRFNDLRGSKSVSQVYVELDTYLMPLAAHEHAKERAQTEPLLSAIGRSPLNCAVLGTAGAGKTTSIQKICVDFFKQGKALANYNLPLLIKLRNIDGEKENPIFHALRVLLSLEVRWSTAQLEDSIDRDFFHSIEKKLVARYLDGLRALLLLDGFDELATESARAAVVRDVEELIASCSASRIVITSRSSDFQYSMTGLEKFEIAPLSRDQVVTFARRWLQSDAKASDFLDKVFSSPFSDTTIRPLTVAHLCAIYERIQDIPEKPKSVYRRVVQLLLEEWDSQRHIKRPSAYAKFDHDRKFEFLAHLAYHLTTELRQLRFSTDSLKSAYKEIHAEHGLPANEALKVATELESHSGLILESGRDFYEFAHKSIQEYLAADYIVRLPSLTLVEAHLSLLPNELAIATALSSKPAAFLAELFLRVVDVERESTPWLAAYMARLVLEKPDLNIGTSHYSAIAAFYLLSRLEAGNPASVLLAAAVPARAGMQLRQFYSISERDRMNTFLRLTARSPTYKLPTSLRVPTELLER